MCETHAGPSMQKRLASIPEARRGHILAYTAALCEAKEAGVHGDPVGKPEVYFARVVEIRAEAAADDASWDRCFAEMQADIAKWKARIADHTARTSGSRSGGTARGAVRPLPDAGATSDATAILQRADQLSEVDLDWLAAILDAQWEQEVKAVVEAIPGIKQPGLATLRCRAWHQVQRLDGFREFERAVAPYPRGVRLAAGATFARGHLARPLEGILLGPWKRVVEDDSSWIKLAWTPEGQAMRSDRISLPSEAFEDRDESF
jgi:hypothetical protein